MKKESRKRPAHVDKAMKELRAYASTEVAKNQIVQFRVDDTDFERLVNMASLRKQPLGSMIRQWAFERLSMEELQLDRSSSVAEKPSTYKPYPDKFVEMQNKIDHLSKTVQDVQSRLRKHGL